jgi:hypothetical protein
MQPVPAQRRPIRYLIATLLLSALSGLAPPAGAKDVLLAKVWVPASSQVGNEPLLLNGAGLRKMLGFKVYVAALYLPQPVHDARQLLAQESPRRLQITLLRDTTTEDNLDALKDGLIDNNPTAELDALKTEIDHFFVLVQQVHEVPAGTVILLDYTPETGTHLSIGGKKLGTIPGRRFNRALMKIWLGDDPIQVSLKKALLGLSNS